MEDKKHPPNVFQRGSQHISTFGEKYYLMKLLNTLVSFRWLLEQGLDHLATERHSSHPLENFFGNVRRVCENDDDHNKIKFHIAKSSISVTFMNDLNLNTSIKTRMNIAGTTINDYDIEEITDDSQVSSWDIANSLENFAKVHSFDEFKKNNELKFGLKWIISIISQIILKDPSKTINIPGILSGNQILSN